MNYPQHPGQNCPPLTKVVFLLCCKKKQKKKLLSSCAPTNKLMANVYIQDISKIPFKYIEW